MQVDERRRRDRRAGVCMYTTYCCYLALVLLVATIVAMVARSAAYGACCTSLNCTLTLATGCIDDDVFLGAGTVCSACATLAPTFSPTPLPTFVPAPPSLVPPPTNAPAPTPALPTLAPTTTAPTPGPTYAPPIYGSCCGQVPPEFVSNVPVCIEHMLKTECEYLGTNGPFTSTSHSLLPCSSAVCPGSVMSDDCCAVSINSCTASVGSADCAVHFSTAKFRAAVNCSVGSRFVTMAACQDDGSCYVAPTPVPTRSPTPAPTAPPPTKMPTPAPTSNPNGACCSNNDTICQVSDPGVCTGGGGSFKGTGTNCTTIGLCGFNPLGACCNTDTNVCGVNVPAASCVALGGNLEFSFGNDCSAVNFCGNTAAPTPAPPTLMPCNTCVLTGIEMLATDCGHVTCHEPSGWCGAVVGFGSTMCTDDIDCRCVCVFTGFLGGFGAKNCT